MLREGQAEQFRSVKSGQDFDLIMPTVLFVTLNEHSFTGTDWLSVWRWGDISCGSDGKADITELHVLHGTPPLL